MKKFYESEKLYDGFSACFRQWRAEETHCKFVHGYAISFRLYFAGDLDEKNWVFDFGGMKRAKHTIDGRKPKEWFDYMFDHTTIVANDDPFLHAFNQMQEMGLIQLRTLPDVGAEKFAEFVYYKVNEFLMKETEGRVKLRKVTCYENRKNSASYSA